MVTRSNFTLLNKFSSVICKMLSSRHSEDCGGEALELAR